MAGCRNVKVRRNVKSLGRDEKERLVNALNKLVRNGRYKEVGNIHGAPGTICPNKESGFCCPHGDLFFLPWHRLYMAQMEEELGEPLPYWDWTEDPEIPDLWEGIRAPVKEGITQRRWCGANQGGRWCGPSPFVRRAQNIRIDNENLKNLTKDAFEQNKTEDFSDHIAQPHTSLHVTVGSDMIITAVSAYDPIFYLHHAYVDYQWAFWQELQKLRGINEPTPRLFHQENPPFNRAEERNGFKNNNQRTLENNRGRDTLEYKKNFCYEYDKLIFDGKTPSQFIRAHLNPSKIDQSGQVFRSSSLDGHQSLPPKGKCDKVCDKADGKTFCEEVCAVGKRGSFVKVFVGVVMPRDAPSGVSAFDLCQGGKCVEGGEVSTFGSTLEPVNNTKQSCKNVKN